MIWEEEERAMTQNLEKGGKRSTAFCAAGFRPKHGERRGKMKGILCRWV
jgi:hypothetical protein